jgi:hypothetical protein
MSLNAANNHHLAARRLLATSEQVISLFMPGTLQCGIACATLKVEVAVSVFEHVPYTNRVISTPLPVFRIDWQ